MTETERLVPVGIRTWRHRSRSVADFADVPLATHDDSDFVFGRWMGHHCGKRPRRWHSIAHFEEREEVMDIVSAGHGMSSVPSFLLRRRWPVFEINFKQPAVENTIFLARARMVSQDLTPTPCFLECA